MEAYVHSERITNWTLFTLWKWQVVCLGRESGNFEVNMFKDLHSRHNIILVVLWHNNKYTQKFLSLVYSLQWQGPPIIAIKRGIYFPHKICIRILNGFLKEDYKKRQSVIYNNAETYLIFKLLMWIHALHMVKNNK